MEAIKLDDYRRESMKADIEKGYDRLAHGITNALANPAVKLSAREYQVILAVISKTYRFQKNVDWISNTQLSELTGIKSNHIATVKKALINKNILVEDGNKIGINPYICDWNTPKNGIDQYSQKRESILPKTGVNTPKNGSNKSQKRESHKKETITKETITKEKAYAFEGETVKINQKDFDRMKKLYSNLNLVDELQQVDFELKGKKDWFAAMNAKLNYRNKNLKPSYQRSQGPDWMDGAI